LENSYFFTTVTQSDRKRPTGGPHISWGPLWRMIYHFTTSVWKMPPSWHWTGHSGGYWQQVELHTEIVRAKQWRWWWQLIKSVRYSAQLIKPLTVTGISQVSKSTPLSARHVYVAVSVTRDCLMVSCPVSSSMMWRDPGAGLMTSPLRRHWIRRLCASDGSVVALHVTVMSSGADITCGSGLSTMTVLATAAHQCHTWCRSIIQFTLMYIYLEYICPGI